MNRRKFLGTLAETGVADVLPTETDPTELENDTEKRKSRTVYATYNYFTPREPPTLPRE